MPGLKRQYVPSTETIATPSLRNLTATARLNNRDPAALAAAGNFATQTLESAFSLDSRNLLPPNQAKTLDATTTMLKKQSLQSLRRSEKTARRGNQNNEIARSNDTADTRTSGTATTTFDLISSKRTITKNFYLDKRRVSGAKNVYCIISAINKKGKNNRRRNLTFEKITKKINHQRNLIEFISNAEPPEVKILDSNLATVTFEIKRIDPTLKGIKVLRFVENPYFLNTILEDRGKLKFSNNNSIIYTDSVDNVKPNKVTYRFAVVNQDKTIGEFNSVTIPSYQKNTDPQNTSTTPISILARNNGPDSVKIEVKTLTDNILSLRLLRQELFKNGEFSDTVVQIRPSAAEKETLVLNQKSTFSFFDQDTVLGRKYRYFVAYRIGIPGMAGISEETLSDEDEILIRRFSYEPLPFAVNVSQPTITQDSQGLPEVNFVLDVTETKELFNTVIDALRSAGISEQFINNLQEDKFKARDFIAMIVERYNPATGKKVSFGIQPAGNFSDNQETRRKLGIPAPKRQVEYKYVFKICLQDPSVFLQSDDIAIENSYGTQINKKASRFSRKIWSRLGVLPSESDVLNGVSIERLILESQFGLEIVRKATSEFNTFDIKNITISSKSYAAILTWKILGDGNQISYFNIFCTIDGKKNLLGAISYAPKVKNFKFFDDRYFNSVGDKSYQVEAIDFEGNSILISEPLKIVKNFSVPRNMLTGIVNGNISGRDVITTLLPTRPDYQNISQPSPQDTQMSNTGITSALSSLSMQSQATSMTSKQDFDAISENLTVENPTQYWSAYDLPKIGKLADDSNAALQNSWQGLAYPSRKNKNLLSKNVNSPKDDPTASKRKLGPSLDGLDAQIESGKIII